MPSNRNPLTKAALLPALAMALALSANQPALSASDGDGDSQNSGSSDSAKKPLFAIKCKEGKVWVKEKLRCIDESEVKQEDQSSIYEHGRDLAYAGKYEDAIATLSAAPDQNDPRVLNMLGYSSRKSGNMDIALTYYRRAVAANPDYSLVREYLGEAFIQLGMLEKAREQLTEIERICGNRNCDEYGQLASLIVESQL